MSEAQITCPKCSADLLIDKDEMVALQGTTISCLSCNADIILPSTPIADTLTLKLLQKQPDSPQPQSTFGSNVELPSRHKRTTRADDNILSTGKRWAITTIATVCIISASVIGNAMYTNYIKDESRTAIDAANACSSLMESINVLKSFSLKHPLHSAANEAKHLLDEQTKMYQEIQTATKQSELGHFNEAVVILIETVNRHEQTPKVEEVKTCLDNIQQRQSDFQTKQYELARIKKQEEERKQEEAFRHKQDEIARKQQNETARRAREAHDRQRQQDLENERRQQQAELEQWNIQQAAQKKSAMLRAQQLQEDEQEAETRRANHLAEKRNGKAAPVARPARVARSATQSGHKWGNCPKCGLPYETKYIERSASQEYEARKTFGAFSDMTSYIPYCPRCSKE